MSETKKCISTLDMEKVSAILLDVAGTTTAISFVKETLYPFIIKNAEEFLKNSWENEDVKKAISQFEEKDLDITKATEVIKNLTEKDDSNSGLKIIQGMLLKKGYESGELKGNLFDDVLKFFQSWSSSKKFAIFSSGSVESQQLLFKNSSEGDLTSHIKKFFDTSLGSKTDSETYKKIAKELEVTPVDILFLTDDVKEAEAAKSADVNVVLVEREGNAPLTEEAKTNFTIVNSFADITVEKMKRKLEEASAEEPPTKMAKIEINAAEDNVEKSSEIKETEEKKETETIEEAMEVDEQPIAEKVEEEKVPIEEVKSEVEKPVQGDKKEETETIESKTEETKQAEPEAMEVDSKDSEVKKDDAKTEETSTATEEPSTATKEPSTATEEPSTATEEPSSAAEEPSTATEQKQNAEEQTNKAESEIGTQTKCAATNECETQTTISIAAVDELPIKDVQDKLMATESGKTEEPIEVDKVKKDEEKKIEPMEENDSGKVEKTDEEKSNTEEKVQIQIENGTAEVKEVQAESKDGVEKIGEKSEKEKEDVKENTDDIKANGTCEKDDESKVEKEVIADKKENGDDKKESVSQENGDATSKENGDNASQENGDVPSQENGVKDKVIEPVEKENKSQLANGKESEVSNGEANEPTNGTLEQNEEEIKVKKIGDNVESAAVSVEA